jgi:predicted TIM-barrel fold metal-dependent hydrolase
MPLPGRFRSPPNPQHLTENIRGFERLLAHNRMARVVWAHVGWDNTGDATVELYDRLLAEHPNLYLQLKAYRDSNSENMILADGRIKPEWMRLIESHPDRFVLGSDNFYGIPDKTRPFPDSSMGSRMILRDLSPELARKVGVENARRMYRFNAPDPK